jgi:hypothetical protein
MGMLPGALLRRAVHSYPARTTEGIMMDNVLLQIQQRQFSDKRSAEQLLYRFVREAFPLDVIAVELRPSVVSLNSFSGFLTLADGGRLFFKTHTEPDSVIDEFYNAEILIKAGYPMVRPLHSSMEAGRQFLIYEVVEDPSVFDVAWQIEGGDCGLVSSLTEAQNRADRDLLNIYLETSEIQSSTAAATAPIHQLFYHRLTGPRLLGPYAHEATFLLPNGLCRMADLRRCTWTINGQRYTDNLNALISRSTYLLQPGQGGPSVVGHGDAHNGNLFFCRDERRLIYFDPAFAGRHDPLLDLAKPLFHNTFAMWMYYPEVKRDELKLSFRITEDTIFIEHNHQLPAIRQMFLESKLNHVLAPLVYELRRRGRLTPEWRMRLKAALFCCPLLTKNLSDRSLFPAEIGLLGLAFAVEMGAESTGERSLIDRCLDRAEEQVR